MSPYFSFKLSTVLSLVMTVCIRKRVDVYIDIQIGLYVCRLQIAGTVCFIFDLKYTCSYALILEMSIVVLAAR